MFTDYVFTFPLAMHKKWGGGDVTREMMHSGQGANLKSLFFPVCCHLSWLNKTRRRKREIGFSVNVNILIKANTKHSELLTKKKLNWIMKGMQMKPFLCMITRSYAFCIFCLCWRNLCSRTRCSGTRNGRWITHMLADDSWTYQNIGSEIAQYFANPGKG